MSQPPHLPTAGPPNAKYEFTCVYTPHFGDHILSRHNLAGDTPEEAEASRQRVIQRILAKLAKPGTPVHANPVQPYGTVTASAAEDIARLCDYPPPFPLGLPRLPQGEPPPPSRPISLGKLFSLALFITATLIFLYFLLHPSP